MNLRCDYRATAIKNLFSISQDRTDNKELFRAIVEYHSI